MYFATGALVDEYSPYLACTLNEYTAASLVPSLGLEISRCSLSIIWVN